MAYPKTVEAFFERETPWVNELLKLREICLSTGMEEALKWGMPHYHHNGKNLLGICGFKSYYGLWFHYGAQLPDPAGVLTNAQPGKTKMMRQWRMTTKDDMNEELIKTYLKAAMDNAP